jgi:outer membrane lipoprotein carrier protein
MVLCRDKGALTMKLKMKLLTGVILILFYAQGALSQSASLPAGSSEKDSQLLLEDVLKNVEKRYASSSFSTQFYQTLTLKSMDITDTASGKAFFKDPGMMRWEYEEPDRQIIVTNSDTLWIYRPEDNQVMTGKSPSFFSGGKGASFLTDMNMIRQKFAITFQEKNKAGHYVLKLVPSEKTLDVAAIYISISAKTFNIVQITTYNSYGDETIIELTDIQFKPKLDDSMFRFQIPKGVDVLQLGE